MAGIAGAVFAAGRYTVTYNGAALGLMEGDQQSPVIEVNHLGEPINNSDGYAKSTIDSIYQGADWFAQWTHIEWLAAVRTALWPYHATLGQMGVIGRLASDVAAALVFAVVAATPSATSGPMTITASKALPAHNMQSKFLLGPTLRKTTIRMQLYPSGAAGSEIWFSTT